MISKPKVATKPARVTEAFLHQAKKLLAIRSVIDRPEERSRALECIVDIIRAHKDIQIEYFERHGVRSLLAYHGLERPKRFTVLLNGHVDVVAGDPPQFEPFIAQERLYGRGALDMKVAALILTQAFCEVAAQVPYPLGLQIVTDEEPGGYDGAQYQFERGVRTDFYLTGEQSRNDIAIAAKGMCRMIIQEQGVSAHSGYLWRGENAILKLTTLVEKLHAIYPVPIEEAWVTTVNVSRLHTLSEGHFNRVPAEAELHLDIRPLVEDPLFASEESIRAFIKDLAPTAQITYFTFEKGHEVEADNPIFQTLVAAAERAKGAPVKFLRRHAQSDLRHYIVDRHTIGVEFGLKGKNDHGDGEYVDLASIPIMQQAMHDFLVNVSTEGTT